MNAIRCYKVQEAAEKSQRKAQSWQYCAKACKCKKHPKKALQFAIACNCKKQPKKGLQIEIAKSCRKKT